MTKIDIFSGFLGAGKTTLIRKLISEAFKGEKLVLIENEFGEIAIDGGFLQDAGIEITEMSQGCICCSLVGDFGKALRQVLETYHPDRILIEPSGVGKLSDVIRAVQNLHMEDVTLNSFTTVADANKCKMYMKNFGEFYNDQIEHANSIILSRTDGIKPEKLDACVALLREHNQNATIITTLGTRRYIKKEKKSLMPTQLGFDVTKILSEYFSDIVDAQFTAQMEDNLDSVELQKLPWKNTIDGFYGNFRKELDRADAEVERIEQEVVLSDEVCELCGKPMAIKEGRFGQFLACTGYPECTNTKAIVIPTGVKCPKCGKEIVQKRSRKGRIFYGCSGYPDCDVVFWNKPIDRTCPKCGSLLMENTTKKYRYKCSNSECDYREE